MFVARAKTYVSDDGRLIVEPVQDDGDEVNEEGNINTNQVGSVLLMLACVGVVDAAAIRML
jgi:hypothetical protein